MKNIIVAIGGSGARVAEAFVRLLGIGFPLRKEPHGVLTSAGSEELEIWRVDTDQSSGAGDLLKTCVDEYQLLQENLEHGWAMRVNPNIVHLNPLALPRRSELDNPTPTLAGILNSGMPGRSKPKTQALLDLFYTPEEQREDVSRGFYQKPFIGAPIMSVFVNSLDERVAAAVDNQATTDAALQVNFQQLQSQAVRFFLCGSLHGGTGASGIAVFGQFLNKLKDKHATDWQVAACLLSPFSLPPQPFEVPSDGGSWDNEKIKKWFELNKPLASLRFSEEEKIRAFKQIARGFYADLEGLNNRALHNLSYYESALSHAFDQLYLVGKPGNMDQLPAEMWSNGGNSQRNPLNSAEAVAAITALRYFSGTRHTSGTGTYIVASANQETAGPSVNLYDLPKYEVAGDPKLVIDPEKVFLATAMARHLITYEIKWAKDTEQMLGELALATVYRQEPERKQPDHENFAQAATRLREFMQATLDVTPSSETKAIGWNQEEVWKRLDGYLPTDAGAAQTLTESFVGVQATKVWGPLKFGGTPAKPAQVGNSVFDVKMDEFRRWMPPGAGKLNRGAYFRWVWWQIYQTIHDPQVVEPQ